MIFDGRDEYICEDLFLILPVFTNRTELGILGCEVLKIGCGKRRDWRREGGDGAEREGSAIPPVSKLKKWNFSPQSPIYGQRKVRIFPPV